LPEIPSKLVRSKGSFFFFSKEVSGPAKGEKIKKSLFCGPEKEKDKKGSYFFPLILCSGENCRWFLGGKVKWAKKKTTEGGGKPPAFKEGRAGEAQQSSGPRK